MSSSLARRDISKGVARRGTSRAVVRAVSRAVDEVQGQAVVHAARVDAQSYVAQVALRCTEALTAQELGLSAMYPDRSYRFRAIADAYTAVAISEVHGSSEW